MKRGPVVLLVLLATLALVASACGDPQSVGSERLLEGVDEEIGGGPRLGERVLEEEEEEDGQQVAVAVEATPEPTPQPTAEVKYFDVTLIANSPFYAPGNHLITTVGVTLRVTNLDDSAERPRRSFTAENEAFDSGMLSHGQQWTIKLTTAGTWSIIDRGLPFASAILEVR